MKITRLKLVVVLVCLVVAGVWGYRRYGPYPIVNARPNGRTIVALGDSLTYGVGADAGEDFPSLLSRRFGVEIVNKGVPGDTTADALARLERDALALDPKIVIVLLGGNDWLRRRPEDEAFANLETIVRRLQDAGALVLLVGLKGPLGGHGGRYRALARRMGCPYVPNAMRGILLDESLKADNLHPNAEGYALMADRIGAVLEKHL